MKSLVPGGETAEASELERDSSRIAAELIGSDVGTDPFVAAVRATRMPMIITNPRLDDNPVVFVNEAFCRLTGYNRSEILGRNCRFLQGRDTESAAKTAIRQAIELERPLEIDIKNYRKDGTPFWNRLLLAPVNDLEGKLAYFFASQVDVTLERERLLDLENSNAALIAELADKLRAQEASENDLRFILEAAEFGSWQLDLDTRELISSPTCRKIFGRDPGLSFSYTELLQAVHPEDQSRMQAAVATSIANGEDYDIEYRVITPANDVRWVAIRGRPEFDSNGVARRMAGISLDISERRRAERMRQGLVDLSDAFRDLDTSAGISWSAGQILGKALDIDRAGYGTVDPDAETITIECDWNAQGVQSLAGTLHFRDYGSYIEDLTRGETVVFEDAKTDPRTAATAAALEAINARAVVNMPVVEQGRTVAIFYLNHGAARVWHDDELTFLRDVAQRTRLATERVRAEAALRSLNETLEAQVEARSAERDRLWNLSQDMLARAGYDGMMSAVSPAWTQVLGWSREELLSRGYASFMHPEDMPPTLAAIQRMAESGTPARFENRIASRDGSFKPIEWTVSPEGDGQNFIAVGRDLSEAKAREAELATAQEALRQSQKMEAMGSLTGGVAHDFNNLLTPIIGSLDLLFRTRVGTERERRLIGGALQSAERAQTLVQRLLAFARRQPLQPTAVDVERLVESMAGLLRSTIGPTVQLRLQLSATLPAARADQNQLEMALLNLAVNARDAMPSGGELTISAEAASIEGFSNVQLDPGDYVRLCVSDTGLGMDEETRQRAVEPFFSTKGVGRGTGLGLSMVHGLAAQLGGVLTIDSELDVGTSIALWLPASEINAACVVRPEDTAELASSHTGTALLVEDEELVRMSTADMLTDLGFEVIEAASGEEALRILQSGARVDVLVSDHLMPGKTGVELAAEVKMLRPDLPVLIVSGYADAAGIAADLPRLTKPFKKADLASSLREVGLSDGVSENALLV